jgi:hypothetical protein
MPKDLRVASYGPSLADLAGRAIGHVGVMSRQRCTIRIGWKRSCSYCVRVAAEIERQDERRFHDLFEFSPDAILMTNQMAGS